MTRPVTAVDMSADVSNAPTDVSADTFHSFILLTLFALLAFVPSLCALLHPIFVPLHPGGQGVPSTSDMNGLKAGQSANGCVHGHVQGSVQ